MAFTEEKVLAKFDMNPEKKCVSIAMDNVVKKDGEVVARNRHRCAFMPGDLDKVKAYLGVETSPEIAYLESLWTEEVIAAYQASIAEE